MIFHMIQLVFTLLAALEEGRLAVTRTLKRTERASESAPDLQI